ncbi:hypothetical protein [Roseateles cavernae]|uniref:hypothetical protein n=1 Tax=Roseateles cavernae TaxID=3153578 RepID=UPI0032E4C547
MNYALRYPRFWLIYFVVSAAMVAISSGAAFVAAIGGKGSVQNAVGQIIGVLALWPLFGYVRQRRLNPRWLWRVLLAIAGCGQVGASGILLFMLFKTGSGEVLMLLLGLTLTGVPFVVALFQYIHRSPHIWEQAVVSRL